MTSLVGGERSISKVALPTYCSIKAKLGDASSSTASKQLMPSFSPTLRAIFGLEPSVAVVFVDAKLPFRHDPLQVPRANFLKETFATAF
jgi:hypothetical protein